MSLLLVAASFSFAASGAEKGDEARGEAKASRVRVVRSWPEPVTVGGKTGLGRVEIAFDYDEETRGFGAAPMEDA